MSKITIKTVFRGEVRRVSVAQARLKIKVLERLVRKQFPALEDHAPLLRYQDDEEDLITVRINDELEEAVRVARRLNKVLRLLVSVDRSRAAAAAKAKAAAAASAAAVEESKADADDNWRSKNKAEFKAAFVADKELEDGVKVQAGAALTKTWTVKNAGDVAWPAGLEAICVGGNMAAEGARVALPAAAPGAEVDVTVELTAPKEAGRGKSVWRFEGFEGDRLWAEVMAVEAESKEAAEAEDDAKPDGGFAVAFVADKTLADGSEVAAGAALTKTWTVKNAGDVAWPHGGVMIACAGGNMAVAEKFQVLPTLAPGAAMDVTVELTAPKEAGRCKSVWVFQNASGERLGDVKLWTDVTVVAEADTAAAEAVAEEGDAAAATETPDEAPAKNAEFKVAFVADKTLEDGAEVEAGAELTKTWTVKNAGDAAWPAGVVAKCVGGNMAVEEKEGVALPILFPNAEIDITVHLTAPAQGPGKSVWVFENDAGDRVGHIQLWTAVVVPTEPAEAVAEVDAVVAAEEPAAEAKVDGDGGPAGAGAADRLSITSLVVGALAGGLVGVGHVLRGGAAPATASESDVETDGGFKTAEEDADDGCGVALVVPADAEAAIETVDVPAVSSDEDLVVVGADAAAEDGDKEQPAWAAELNQLADMGFADGETILPLLEQHGGNVHQVVLTLLQRFQ